MPGVDICFLEVREEELAGSDIIAVRPEDHVWQLQLGSDREEVL